jgi:hypothetical protein
MYLFALQSMLFMKLSKRLDQSGESVTAAICVPLDVMGMAMHILTGRGLSLPVTRLTAALRACSEDWCDSM